MLRLVLGERISPPMDGIAIDPERLVRELENAKQRSLGLSHDGDTVLLRSRLEHIQDHRRRDLAYWQCAKLRENDPLHHVQTPRFRDVLPCLEAKPLLGKVLQVMSSAAGGFKTIDLFLQRRMAAFLDKLSGLLHSLARLDQGNPRVLANGETIFSPIEAVLPAP